MRSVFDKFPSPSIVNKLAISGDRAYFQEFDQLVSRMWDGVAEVWFASIPFFLMSGKLIFGCTYVLGTLSHTFCLYALRRANFFFFSCLHLFCRFFLVNFLNSYLN